MVTSQEALRATSLALIRSVLPTEKGIRLVGVTVSNFERSVTKLGDGLPLFGESGTGAANAGAFGMESSGSATLRLPSGTSARSQNTRDRKV